MIAALILAAATAHPVLPAQGTYTYTFEAAGKPLGTTQVVIKRNGDAIGVSESGTVESTQFSTQSSYDAALREERYDLTLSATQQLHAVVGPAGVDFTGLGTQHLDTSKAPRAIVDDGLASGLVLLPAIFASGGSGMSFVTTNAPRVIPIELAPATEHPPAGIAPGALGLRVSGGGITQTLWYDPKTLVVLGFDGAGGFTLRLTPPKSATP
jgi:hypothetical protein